MIKIKYIREFQDGCPMVVTGGEKADYLRASQWLANKKFAHLNDPGLGLYYDSPYVDPRALYLDEEECKGLAEMFQSFGTDVFMSCHDYFETKALDKYDGKDAEIMITYHEYSEENFIKWY